MRFLVDVGQYPANPWGFYDMHGNVYEWTADWYGAYSSRTVIDPQGAASGSNRVTRGSSYCTDGMSMFSATRRYYPPGDRSANLGFRVALKFK